MKKGYALYDAVDGYGYCVQVFLKITHGVLMVEEYRAGDSNRDSQVFGTGQVKLKTLLKWARDTAVNMLEGQDIKGTNSRDEDILSEERERLCEEKA